MTQREKNIMQPVWSSNLGSLVFKADTLHRFAMFITDIISDLCETGSLITSEILYVFPLIFKGNG